MVKELSEEARAEVVQLMGQKGMIAQAESEKIQNLQSSVSQEDLNNLIKQFMSTEQEDP